MNVTIQNYFLTFSYNITKILNISKDSKTNLPLKFFIHINLSTGASRCSQKFLTKFYIEWLLTFIHLFSCFFFNSNKRIDSNILGSSIKPYHNGVFRENVTIVLRTFKVNMFSRTSDILNYARLSKVGCSCSFFNNNNYNNDNSSTSMITIMIIIMLMIMIMSNSNTHGNCNDNDNLNFIIERSKSIPFAAGASFLKVPIINGPRKAVCCLFSR